MRTRAEEVGGLQGDGALEEYSFETLVKGDDHEDTGELCRTHI
jgi:hypothetical protein